MDIEADENTASCSEVLVKQKHGSSCSCSVCEGFREEHNGCESMAIMELLDSGDLVMYVDEQGEDRLFLREQWRELVEGGRNLW